MRIMGCTSEGGPGREEQGKRERGANDGNDHDDYDMEKGGNLGSPRGGWVGGAERNQSILYVDLELDFSTCG